MPSGVAREREARGPSLRREGLILQPCLYLVLPYGVTSPAYFLNKYARTILQTTMCAECLHTGP